MKAFRSGTRCDTLLRCSGAGWRNTAATPSCGSHQPVRSFLLQLWMQRHLLSSQRVDELLETLKGQRVSHATAERSVVQDHLVDLIASRAHSPYPGVCRVEPTRATHVPQADLDHLKNARRPGCKSAHTERL